MTWTIDHINKLYEAGKIRDASVKGKSICKKPVTKKPKNIPKRPEALVFIEMMLKGAGIAYETEYRFNPDRKFRFDIAIVENRVAIEFEGLMSAKSRHTTVTGYTNDCEKYNLAQSMGWKVYRYTALNAKNFVNDLKKILE